MLAEYLFSIIAVTVFKIQKNTNSAATILSRSNEYVFTGYWFETLHILFMSDIWSICTESNVIKQVVVLRNMPRTFSSSLEATECSGGLLPFHHQHHNIHNNVTLIITKLCDLCLFNHISWISQLSIYGVAIIPSWHMWLIHTLEDEVEVSLVVYVVFIAPCHVHCIIHGMWLHTLLGVLARVILHCIHMHARSILK
jgi:hypothetical protein